MQGPQNCVEGRNFWTQVIVSLFQRLDLTDPLVQRQSTHELKGLIRESNQKFKIENLRGGKATSSKLGGSTSKSHFLRLLPTSGRKSGHDPQHWPLLDQHALQAATASQLIEHIRLAESCCCVFTAPLGQIFETTSKVTETHWTGGVLVPLRALLRQTVANNSVKEPEGAKDQARPGLFTQNSTVCWASNWGGISPMRLWEDSKETWNEVVRSCHSAFGLWLGNPRRKAKGWASCFSWMGCHCTHGYGSFCHCQRLQ